MHLRYSAVSALCLVVPLLAAPAASAQTAFERAREDACGQDPQAGCERLLRQKCGARPSQACMRKNKAALDRATDRGFAAQRRRMR